MLNAGENAFENKYTSRAVVRRARYLIVGDAKEREGGNHHRRRPTASPDGNRGRWGAIC